MKYLLLVGLLAVCVGCESDGDNTIVKIEAKDAAEVTANITSAKGSNKVIVVDSDGSATVVSGGSQSGQNTGQ